MSLASLLPLIIIAFCALSVSAASLLRTPLAQSPASLYVSPVAYNHTLVGPLALPATAAASWFVAQWDNPRPLSGAVASVTPGPARGRCSEPPAADARVAWYTDNGAMRICAWTQAPTGVTYEIASDGSGDGGVAPQVACGQEFDAFLSPVDTAYSNAPPNIIMPSAGGPTLAKMLTLNITFTMRLGNFTHYPRCGAKSSCGPSGALDYAYAVMGLVLSNPTSAQTIFYQLMLADTRATIAACNDDPCTVPYTYWFFTSLPTLGINDASAYLGLPCLHPTAAAATSFNFNILPRLAASVAQAAKSYGSDPNMGNWVVNGLYIGTGLQGSAVAVASIGGVDVLYT